ncbi:hypothetical protein CBR_g22210 [Chara braunii]|uniref:Uncharacterized protein n=1 Tax=Chara braunii TaxID=69332 RepID=A0A388L2J8_CHABU|nr:hypothetical protein CBR_g22210 [Chara braunii]|eukprot:GBG76462.1 hypothetical protein CBR_g22210 [Chara braunii]
MVSTRVDWLTGGFIGFNVTGVILQNGPMMDMHVSATQANEKQTLRDGNVVVDLGDGHEVDGDTREMATREMPTSEMAARKMATPEMAARAMAMREKARRDILTCRRGHVGYSRARDVDAGNGDTGDGDAGDGDAGDGNGGDGDAMPMPAARADGEGAMLATTDLWRKFAECYRRRSNGGCIRAGPERTGGRETFRERVHGNRG